MGKAGPARPSLLQPQWITGGHQQDLIGRARDLLVGPAQHVAKTACDGILWHDAPANLVGDDDCRKRRLNENTRQCVGLG